MMWVCLSRGGPIRLEADISVLRRAYFPEAGLSVQGWAYLSIQGYLTYKKWHPNLGPPP